MLWWHVKTIKSLQTQLGQRIGKLTQPWGKTVNVLQSFPCKIRLTLILLVLIWMGKKSSARSTATYEKLAAVLICFSRDITAEMAAANWGYHLIKVSGFHPPWSILDFLFLFFSIWIGELNGNIMATTTPAPFKHLLVALISTTSEIHDCFILLAGKVREGRNDKSFHTVLSITVAFVLELRKLTRGFF